MPSRSPCASQSLNSCRSNESCLTVRRHGTPHHCRCRPRCMPPTKSPRRTRKTSSTRKRSSRSARSRIGHALRTATQQTCNSFSLTQRGGTCYMAAATLLFGRVAMKYTKESGLRHFVRRSMANAWDDAQGTSTEVQCPLIPKEIRQYYAAILENMTVETSTGRVVSYPFQSKVMNKASITCFPNCTERDLVNTGGFATVFATALFWAAKIPCILFVRAIHLSEDRRRLNGSRNLLHTDLLQEITSSISGRLPGFYLCDYMFAKQTWNVSLHTGNDRRLSELLDKVYRGIFVSGHLLVGCILDMKSTKGGSHSMSLFPCVKDTRLHWTWCNSWGQDCYASVASALRVLEYERGYDQVSKITFVTRTLNK